MTLVVHSLFLAEITFSEDITKHFHATLMILEQEILSNTELKETFLLWRKIGSRITDEEYISSKQQVRKKNPVLNTLLQIYTIESVIALIMRSLTLIKLNFAQSEEFKDLLNISNIFIRGRSTALNFLLIHDVPF